MKLLRKGICRETGYPVREYRNTGVNADLWPVAWLADNPANPGVRMGCGPSKAAAVADMLAKNPQLQERKAA